MAGIQEQIRQLGDMNHDVLEEEERFADTTTSFALLGTMLTNIVDADS
jgi:hypothetical protein